MVRVHIERTNASDSNIVHCPRCNRRNLVFKKVGKLIQHQRCANCWYEFS